MTIQEIRWIRALLNKGTATMEEMGKCEKLIKDSAHELLDALEWRIKHRQDRNVTSKTVDFEELCKGKVECEHPKKWDIKSNMLSHKVLEEGYEPYAVAVYGDVFVHFGKRPKPCDLCDKV